MHSASQFSENMGGYVGRLILSRALGAHPFQGYNWRSMRTREADMPVPEPDLASKELGEQFSNKLPEHTTGPVALGANRELRAVPKWTEFPKYPVITGTAILAIAVTIAWWCKV